MPLKDALPDYSNQFWLQLTKAGPTRLTEAASKPNQSISNGYELRIINIEKVSAEACFEMKYQ